MGVPYAHHNLPPRVRCHTPCRSCSLVLHPPSAGRPSTLAPMCDELSCIDSVASWSVSCALPDRPAQRPSGGRVPQPGADS